MRRVHIFKKKQPALTTVQEKENVRAESASLADVYIEGMMIVMVVIR